MACPVALALLFEYQWAVWSTLLYKGARFSFGYKSITINEDVGTCRSQSVQFLLDTVTQPLETAGLAQTGILGARGALLSWLGGDMAASALHDEWTKTAGAHPK